jgi:rhodanese-related sulfurtransferase
VKRRVGIILLVTLCLTILPLVLLYERGVYTFWSQNKIARLNAEGARTLIISKKPTILDVRSQEEFQVSHIDQAIRFIPEILEDVNPQEPVLVYCTASVRSNSLASALRDLGFSQIYEIKGGLLHWKNKGNELVNMEGKTTDSLHTYNAILAPFLRNGTAVH